MTSVADMFVGEKMINQEEAMFADFTDGTNASGLASGLVDGIASVLLTGSPVGVSGTDDTHW